MCSKIFTGKVRHRRHTVRPHHFQYGLFMLYIDLSALDHLFDPYWLWSSKRWNIASFKRASYLGDHQQPLLESVKTLIYNTQQAEVDKVYLLTHLAYYGYCFNPISLYFCLDKENRFTHCIAEVTNTPWGEQHVYVLKPELIKPDIYSMTFKKQLHVSPFLTQDYTYQMRCKYTPSQIVVHIENWQKSVCHFDATLSLRAQPITSLNLAKVLLRFPAMTASIIASIHWQALRLFLKRVPVVYYKRK